MDGWGWWWKKTNKQAIEWRSVGCVCVCVCVFPSRWGLSFLSSSFDFYFF